jgi:hypothetical protein
MNYVNCLNSANLENDENFVFFDVGCDIDYIIPEAGVLDDFTEIALSKYPNSICVGIDPLNWYAYEAKWGKDPRVTFKKIALSDREEKRTMYTPGAFHEIKGHALSSLYKRKVFLEWIEEGIEEIEVDCTTMDKICDDLKINKVDYLKLDTEGAEFLILQGSKELLKNKKIKYIQVEHGCGDDAGWDMQTLENYLNEYGYVKIFIDDYEVVFKCV